MVDYSMEDRKRVAYKEAYVSIVGNFLLAGFKFILGYISRSHGIIADAIHSLSDMFTSIVIIIGYSLSSKKPDKEHPFGHGRMEHITTLVMAGFLVFAGWELLSDSFKSLFRDQSINYNIWIVVGIFATIIIKEGLARYSHKLGLEIESDALEADSWHHRIDAISSIVVIIGFVGERYTGFRVDAIAGMIVSLFVMYSGFEIFKTATDELLGLPPTDEEIKMITEVARKEEKVKGVHDIMVHRYGQEVTVSLHIEIPSDIDLMESHDIADRIEKNIYSKLKARCVVHVDPIDFSDPRIESIYNFLKEIEKEYKNIRSIHDPRFVASKHLAFDLVPEADCNIKTAIKEIKKKLKEKFPFIGDIYVEVDPLYYY